MVTQKLLNYHQIDLKDLWNGIIRKKKWMILTAGFILSGTALFTLHARVFRPVYRGSFTLLINDPMGEENIEKNLYNTTSTLFSNIANKDSNYDINTLITFLKSPIFLEPIANEYNLSVEALRYNLSLDQSSDQKGGISDGILNVNLNFRNIDKKDFNYSKSFNPNKLKTNREKLVIVNKLDIFESIYIKT